MTGARERRQALALAEAVEQGRRPIDPLDRDALRRERIETAGALAALLCAVDALEERAHDLEALAAEQRAADV
jgi:hypothetical protein